ncbi:MAG: hypothetical protein ACPGLV_07650, partial [Bacteroidia bacterium]
KSILTLTLTIITLSACNTIEQKAKQVANKTGEVAGETASEFVEGVSDGIDKTMKCQITVDSILTTKGVSFGKHTIESKPTGTDNRLSIYLIFDQDFEAEIRAAAFNEDGDEIGRSKLALSSKSGDAEYYNFNFNDATNLDAKCRVIFSLVE